MGLAHRPPDQILPLVSSLRSSTCARTHLVRLVLLDIDQSLLRPLLRQLGPQLVEFLLTLFFRERDVLAIESGL